MFRPIAFMLLAAWCLLPPLADASADTSVSAPIAGSWINPIGSVVVTTGPCREHLCGWVTWASATALRDAADAGVPRLIGTQVLKDYHQRADGRWTGRVYVPDMGKTYYSTIEQLDADRLKISGCVLGGWICKNQIWHRHEGNA